MNAQIKIPVFTPDVDWLNQTLEQLGRVFAKFGAAVVYAWTLPDRDQADLARWADDGGPTP